MTNEVLARSLADQAGACAELGSALYAHLLARAADDVIAGGPSATVLAGHETDPPGSALALRFLAAIHRQVLRGQAPEVAKYFPSAGGAEAVTGSWPAVRALLAKRTEEIGRDVSRPCQTNEPGRAVVLLAGLLAATDWFPGLPVRLLEIGASAGLNLYVDRYRIGEFGPPGGAVLADRPWADRVPTGHVEIADRAGCDPAPLDPRSAAGRLTLRASVWADQVERHVRLEAALSTVADLPFLVQQAPASAWLREQLAASRTGLLTVVWHSVVWQYLSAQERVDVGKVFETAGRRAGNDAPLVRLSMEPEHRDSGIAFALRATRWPGAPGAPGGRSVHLADVGGHGPPVRLWRIPREA